MRETHKPYKPDVNAREIMETDTVVVGLVLIVIGIIFGFLFCLGGVLVLVGLVVMIVGLLDTEKPKTVIQYYGQPPAGYGPPGAQIQYQMGSAGSTNFCQHCGQQIAAGAVRCPGCGRGLADSVVGSQVVAKDFPSGFVKCPGCGAQNPEFHRFCFACAADLRSRSEPGTRKPKGEIPMDAMVICPECGAKNVRTERLCRNCDKDLTEVKKLLTERYGG